MSNARHREDRVGTMNYIGAEDLHQKTEMITKYLLQDRIFTPRAPQPAAAVVVAIADLGADKSRLGSRLFAAALFRPLWP